VCVRVLIYLRVEKTYARTTPHNLIHDFQAKEAAAAKFNTLSSAVLEMKRESKHDEESLKMSMKVLEINPEFYSAWNFRRQILSSLQSTSPDINKMLWSELHLLEAAIAKNAKAYCLWTHRLWVIDRLVEQGDSTVLAKELLLCARCRKLHARSVPGNHLSRQSY